jgi:hydroxyacylglutathione hydrolase
MELRQFRYSNGNLSYLLIEGSSTAVIDGGAVREILDYLDEAGLTLDLVLNTHMHSDHTPGNEKLLAETEARFVPIDELIAQGGLELDGTRIQVIPVPGHSPDSIAFHFDGNLVSGDTLFNGTVGNCYTGDYETYFSSLKKLLALPPETRILAGHDLVEYAMGVAKDLEPDNPAIDRYLEKYEPDFVVTTLGDEKAANPFIRFDDPGLDQHRRKTGLPLETEYQRWRALMEIH